MIALTGWIAALVGALWLVRLRTELGHRMELVGRACHELRGSLTAARLGCESAVREGALPAGPGRALELELASAGVAVEDLSAAVAGSPGPWRPESVDVTALLADSLEASRPLALARGIELGLESGENRAVVYADRLRLAQATRNLISNAIEHGAGRVELCAKTDDQAVQIEVSDEGHGLPAGVTELLKGHRRHPGGRHGHGHGLAIVAEVARKHGGTIEASSERGARVAIKLPLRRN